MSANILGLGSYYSYELVFVPIWQNIGILWSLCNITGSGQLFHYESMKWSQLKKNPKVKSLIIETENHKVYYTKSMHSYDLGYENQNEVWLLEYWKQIRSQWTNLMITTQKHSISIQSMDPNDIQSKLNGDSQKSPNQKRGLNPMIKDPSFCMIAAKTVSFWQASCGFDAASVILERWFWWL